MKPTSKFFEGPSKDEKRKKRIMKNSGKEFPLSAIFCRHYGPSNALLLNKKIR